MDTEQRKPVSLLLTPSIHKLALIEAAKAGMKLSAWIAQIIQEKASEGSQPTQTPHPAQPTNQ